MKTIIKRIAMFLIVILSIESVTASTDIDINKNISETDDFVEKILNIEESEEAVETTSEGLTAEDEVVTPSGIAVDILNFVKNLKSDIIKEGVVSPSAIDYEIDYSNIDKEVKSLLNDRYNTLNNAERFLINKYFGLREDTMNICAEKGLDTEYSVPYALIMQILEVDFDSARAMVISNESEKKAVKEAYDFGNLFLENAAFKDEELKNTFIELALTGYTKDEVFDAYIFSLMINEDLENVIADKYNLADNDYSKSNGYEDIKDKYCVNNYAIDKYIEMEYTAEETEIYAEDIKERVKYGNEAVVYASSDDNFDVGYDATFKSGALNYIKGINDNIDPSTGTVAYSQSICNLKGANGLDLNIAITYTSSTSNTAKSVDSRINIASNWRYNFAYITNEDGSAPEGSPKYITLENGSTYELAYIETDNYYIPSECYGNEFKLYKDTAKSGGTTSAYKLVKKNGEEQFFNDLGKWIKTRNRFGNTISVVVGESTSNHLVIEDTVGRRVVFDATVSGNNTTQTITTPDGNKTTIFYSKETYETYRRKTILTKIVDAEGNQTKFEYNVSNKDDCKNALITKITMPSGLENCYEYMWTDITEVLWEVNNGSYVTPPSTQPDEYDFARVSKTYMAENGSKKNSKTYSYTGDYTRAKKYYYVLCNCWDYREVTKVLKDENGNDIYDPVTGKPIYITVPEYFRNCSCTVYYDGTYWKCTCNRNINCILKGNSNYTYDTTITEENGLSYKYTFNQMDQNTKIDVLSNNTIISNTYIDYKRTNSRCTQPEKIRYVENGMERTESYTYTNLNDIASYKITDKNGTVLSNIEYKYDYENLSSANPGINCYGICTLVKTKMNNTVTVTEESVLKNSGPYKDLYAEYVRIKNNNTLAGEVQYIRDVISDPSGRVVSVYNNADSNKSISTQYVYSEGKASPESVTVSESMGEYYRSEYSYDNNERIIASLNAENYLEKYTYNKIGDITNVEYYKDKVYNIDTNTTGMDKDTVSFSYNYGENKITFTNEKGVKEIYDYDAVGNPVSVTKAGSVLSTYTYDTRLRPKTYTEGKSATTYTYDNRDRVLSEVVKEGTKTLLNKTYTYENNSTGLKVTEKINGDSNSATITNIVQQDVLGRSIMANNAGDITNYEYDMLGNAVQAYNYIGVSNGSDVYLKMDYTYDHMGNVLKAVRTDHNDTANAVTTSASYDMLGRMITSTDGKGNTTEYTYNALGLCTNKKIPYYVDSSGNMQYTNYSYTYDKIGNVTRDSVTEGVINTYAYDHRSRVTQTKAGEQASDYVYDAVGNITEYKTAGGTQVHQYTYDSLNRVTKYTDALGYSETYTYDQNHDMVKKVDRNGNAVNYTYDGLHRVLTEKTKGVNNSWTYGLTGGTITEANDNAVKTYTYNNQGLPNAETVKIGNDSFKINRYYDSRRNDREDSYYKNGTLYQKIKYVYDNKNRLESVYDVNANTNVSTQKVRYYYDKNDNVTSAHYDNNTYNTYSYLPNNLIDCMDLIDKSDSSKLEHLTYQYRADGNMYKKNEVYNACTTTTTYDYDGTGRLVSENLVSDNEVSKIAYTYDNGGNRSTMTLSGYAGDFSEVYSYDKNNRLTGIVKDYGTTSAYTNYTYDKNGNQTKIERYSENNAGTFKLGIENASYNGSSGIEKFTYNGLNELTGYENIRGQYNGKAGLNAEYKYMANGYRLSKSVNGLETRYLWDRDNIIAELNSVNAVTQKYTRGYNLICDDSNKYYMHDIHGNIIETYYKDDKSCDDWYIYNAFGTNKYFNDTCTVNKWGYCDQLMDFETGNYYMRARYYNPDTGRFISEDPIKDGSNWYSYCGGNPVMFWDPSGLTDVMVSYITRKNGGVIYANYDKSGETNSIFISMKGVTKTYSVGNGENNIRIVNGRAVIDNEILMNDFSLTELQSLHLQGDKFDSEADAVEAFALMYLPISIDEEQEYAALIKKENGKYIFDDVKNSALSAGKNLQELEPNERNRVSHRLTNNTTAVIHTHWQDNMYANDFTYIEDYKNMDGKHMYLANSLGEIKYSEQSANGKLIYGFNESRILFSIK